MVLDEEGCVGVVVLGQGRERRSISSVEVLAISHSPAPRLRMLSPAGSLNAELRATSQSVREVGLISWRSHRCWKRGRYSAFLVVTCWRRAQGLFPSMSMVTRKAICG